MLFRSVCRFATAKGKLKLNYGENSISGKLDMTIMNAANDTKYPACLNIRSDYFSVRSFTIH